MWQNILARNVRSRSVQRFRAFSGIFVFSSDAPNPKSMAVTLRVFREFRDELIRCATWTRKANFSEEFRENVKIS